MGLKNLEVYQDYFQELIEDSNLYSKDNKEKWIKLYV